MISVKRERDRPYTWSFKNCELFLRLTASAFKGKVILVTFSFLMCSSKVPFSSSKTIGCMNQGTKDADYTSNQLIPGNLQMYVSTNRSPLQCKTLPAHFSNNLMVYCSLNVIWKQDECRLCLQNSLEQYSECLWSIWLQILNFETVLDAQKDQWGAGKVCGDSQVLKSSEYCSELDCSSNTNLKKNKWKHYILGTRRLRKIGFHFFLCRKSKMAA